MKNIYRDDFPIFSTEENKGMIYFDSAATSQKPAKVLDALHKFYVTNNANPLRGLYDLSVRATDEYEKARHIAAGFINARNDCEIIFTRNASESLNLVAWTYGMANIQEGDEILAIYCHGRWSARQRKQSLFLWNVTRKQVNFLWKK